MWLGLAGLFLAQPVFAQDPHSGRRGFSSGRLTSTGSGTAIKSTTGKVWAVSFFCPTAPCEVALFDGTDVTGTVKWEMRHATANAGVTVEFPVPLDDFATGIVGQISANGVYFVEFE